MVSKIWWDLLLWGMGDRLEHKNDYKTDILLILDVLAWYSLFSLTIQTGNFLVVWLLAAAVKTPQIWIATQLAVGYVMARRARSPPQTVKDRPRTDATPSPGIVSEEP